MGSITSGSLWGLDASKTWSGSSNSADIIYYQTYWSNVEPYISSISREAKEPPLTKKTEADMLDERVEEVCEIGRL